MPHKDTRSIGQVLPTNYRCTGTKILFIFDLPSYILICIALWAPLHLRAKSSEYKTLFVYLFSHLFHHFHLYYSGTWIPKHMLDSSVISVISALIVTCSRYLYCCFLLFKFISNPTILLFFLCGFMSRVSRRLDRVLFTLSSYIFMDLYTIASSSACDYFRGFVCYCVVIVYYSLSYY